MAKVDKRTTQREVTTIQVREKSAVVIATERRGLFRGYFSVAPGQYDDLRLAIAAMVQEMEDA